MADHGEEKKTHANVQGVTLSSSSGAHVTVNSDDKKKEVSDAWAHQRDESLTTKVHRPNEAEDRGVAEKDTSGAAPRVLANEATSLTVAGKPSTSENVGHDDALTIHSAEESGKVDDAQNQTPEEKQGLLRNVCQRGCAPAYTTRPVNNGMPNGQADGKLSDNIRCTDLPLYHYNDVPSWQRCNPYILRGYRAFYSTMMAIKSVMRWHNESINIWSHVVGFLAFLLLTIALFATVLQTSSKTPALYFSRLVYAVFSFGSMMCMLNSSIYHLFNCHCSERVTIILSRIDFLGITVLIITSFLPPLYVGFHCYPVARTVYIVSILTLGTAALACPCTEFFYKHERLRTAVFVAVAFSGLVPLVHACIILPHTRQCIDAFCGVLLMMVLYLIGLLFYVTKFPESHFPGRFDCFLSSHQLWHFFVCMAALVHFCNSVGLYETWSVSDGTC